LAKQEYRLAFLYGERSALDEAYSFFPSALLEVAPDTPAGLLAAGAVLRARPAEAAEAWRRAWESFGEVGALGPLAAARLELGEYEEALRLARLLQGVSQRSSPGYVVAAKSLAALGREAEAVAEMELGASRLPGDPAVLVPLGIHHLEQRRFAQARGLFDKIVAVGSAAEARKRLLIARALEGQGRYLEALREVRIARDLAPTQPHVLDVFVRLAEAVGRYDEAIDALEIASRSPGAAAKDLESRIARLREKQHERLLQDSIR
jgi:tetratricopeptide (TPR) repeat protein